MANVNNINIKTLLDKINKQKDGGIFLPYIQRDFVWEEEKIFALLDSLMRGYPIGSILTWYTDESINYRPFVKDYGKDYNYDETVLSSEGDNFSRQYVIDGQQRLQSLYIALYGTYDKKELYFNTQSSHDGEEGYVFSFSEKPLVQCNI